MKSNICAFKRSKNVIFGYFRDSELWNLVNLGLENCSNILKLKFRVSKMVKNDIFGLFEFTKIWFHIKPEWRSNDQISTKSSLNFTFRKFLEHSATLPKNWWSWQHCYWKAFLQTKIIIFPWKSILHANHKIISIINVYIFSYLRKVVHQDDGVQLVGIFKDILITPLS